MEGSEQATSGDGNSVDVAEIPAERSQLGPRRDLIGTTTEL